jgi:hypothetical protein
MPHGSKVLKGGVYAYGAQSLAHESQDKALKGGNMRKTITRVAAGALLLLIGLTSLGPVAGQLPQLPPACKNLAFSTEEDFVTQGPIPPDGNPIISDGDLLTAPIGGVGACIICARNADLLLSFQVPYDLGLDAVDVIDVERYLVAFSTELNSSNQGQFTAGDLLVTTAPHVIILNQALTDRWKVPYDIGLDGVQFVGEPGQILLFLEEAAAYQRPISASELADLFDKYTTVDIWFSTEGTWSPVGAVGFLDGDLLSARNGMVITNENLLPGSVPAGLPQRGVDFGLDAVATNRAGDRQRLLFSTEILFDGEPTFTDGDVLRVGDGVVATNEALIACFYPKAKMLGLDALSIGVPREPECVSRIDRIGGVDVANISLTDGMVMTGTLGIMANSPFGGRIDFQGNICPDVDLFRVLYREHGSGDPWEPMDVPGSKNWTVKVDAFFPPWPDCDASQTWSSDADGWFNGPDYRALSHPAFGCNPDLSLTVWESGARNELYDVILETKVGAVTISDTVRLVQLDNKPPKVELEKVWGECKEYADEDMPLMVTGRISDTHFYDYELDICGDGYGCHAYPRVAFFDDPTDNIIDTGTVGWDAFKELHEVDVFDLDPNPVKCGYAVVLTGWDRTLWCWFTYPSNFASRCVHCRYQTDVWTFDYVPTP